MTRMARMEDTNAHTDSLATLLDPRLVPQDLLATAERITLNHYGLLGQKITPIPSNSGFPLVVLLSNGWCRPWWWRRTADRA